MNVSHVAFYQNCINGSAPPNKRASRALDKKYFKQHLLNHWSNFSDASELEPAATRSRVKHFTTEPLRSPLKYMAKYLTM